MDNKIDLKIDILRTSDGELVTDLWREWDYYYFWFEEGNGSCDCNRQAFFLKAKNKEFLLEELTCGNNRFLIRVSNFNTGEVLYDELGSITSNISQELQWSK